MLSQLVITFLLRSKRLLISWLQSPSSVIFRSDQIRSVAQSCPTLCDPMNCSTPAVILGPPKIKSDTVSIVSPSISHEVMGPDAMILV